MMATNILLGIACIFLVMAALFESLILPFSIILGSIVFSIFGVFLFFAATGTTFSFMAMIGIMILIGVVVNNGIVLVDHINNLRQEGVSRDKAIVIAGRDRLRPILMTVATTIVGLAPLAMGSTDYRWSGFFYRCVLTRGPGAVCVLRQPRRVEPKGHAHSPTGPCASG